MKRLLRYFQNEQEEENKEKDTEKDRRTTGKQSVFLYL